MSTAPDPSPVDLLVCAATGPELAACPGAPSSGEMTGDVAFAPETAYVLSGVGIPATLAVLLPLLTRLRPCRILNIGIAGAYPGSGLHPGDVVIGTSEVYGDVGFELPGRPAFRSIRDSDFAGNLYRLPLVLADDPDFAWEPDGFRRERGRGCTVNTCTGREETGAYREALFAAAFETMEGAAVAHAGALCGVPVSEVRAISNIASTRAMTPGGIRLALGHLSAYLRECPYGKERHGKERR